MNDDELLMSIIEKDIDLYKFYLDVSLKLSIFVFGTTGAIVSYQQANLAKNSLIGFSLIFPLVLNLGFAVICRRGIRPAIELSHEHQARVNALRLQRNHALAIEAYDLTPLPKILELLGCMYLLTSIALAVFFAIWMDQTN
jgi:hypothetical protein